MGQDQEPGEDKRRYRREPSVIRVNYSTVDKFFSEFATNINEGGMFIETEEPIHEVGTPVTLQFQLPGEDEPLKVTGKVVWTRPVGHPSESPGMGIEFDDLSQGARDQINLLVRSLRTETAKS